MDQLIGRDVDLKTYRIWLHSYDPRFHTGPTQTRRPRGTGQVTTDTRIGARRV